jgi:hypothetical protein
MSTEVLVAVISGAMSFIAAGIALMSQRNVARLDAELEERRHERTKQEQADDLRSRYRDPLMNAAFDLQSRLGNIVGNTFLVRYSRAPDEASRSYARQSTLYVLAEYLGWVEVLRREIQFLDLGDELANRRWVRALEEIRDIMARDTVDPALRVFRAEQRAIGELMLAAAPEQNGARHLECLGYAAFVQRLENDPGFARWFEKLGADIDLLASEPDAHTERVVLLQNALVDVLDLLDPDCRRFGADRRVRLAVPAPA